MLLLLTKFEWISRRSRERDGPVAIFWRLITNKAKLDALIFDFWRWEPETFA